MKIKAPLIGAMLLVVLFWVLAIAQQNYEFLFYAGVMLVLVFILHKTDKVFGYRKLALWGFTSWMLLHLLGGFLTINGVRLYDFILIDLVGEPYSIFKYDQFVHIYCYIVMAMLVSSVVEHVAAADANHWALGTIAVLAATGIGGLNEIIEFATVVLFESTGVGGYTNTALDFCANLIGAIIGVLIYHKTERK